MVLEGMAPGGTFQGIPSHGVQSQGATVPGGVVPVEYGRGGWGYGGKALWTDRQL